MATFFTQLPSFSAISVSGNDRFKYLHGQLTVNTERFVASAARISAHCDFKGKMWNIPLVIDWNDSFFLISHEEGNAASLPELKKYGVFSNVDIDVDQQLIIVAAKGEDAESSLSTLFDTLPKKHLDTISNSSGVAICISTNEPFWLVLLKQSIANERFIPKDKTQIELAHASLIASAIPHIRAKTICEFVPQMMNLQYLDAIDFDKGCYMGQEVIARTKFLEKNKRALYILSGEQPVECFPGDTLEKSIDKSWRRAGTVINSSTYDSTTDILAVLPNDTRVGDVLKLKTSDSVFTVLAHPYPYDPAE